jgi:hypothetical protein
VGHRPQSQIFIAVKNFVAHSPAIRFLGGFGGKRREEPLIWRRLAIFGHLGRGRAEKIAGLGFNLNSRLQTGVYFSARLFFCLNNPCFGALSVLGCANTQYVELFYYL